MCRLVECDECKKPTYAGCGMHVEQVLGNVPKEHRCACREKKATAKATEALHLAEAIRRGALGTLETELGYGGTEDV